MQKTFHSLQFLVLAVLVLMAKPGSAQTEPGQPSEDQIGAFHQVVPGIYRGARPDLVSGLQALAQLKVKTILDIDNDSAFAEEEAKAARELKMTTIFSSMSWSSAPSDDQVNLLLKQLQDPSLQPIFIHCTHGQDRTGLIIGLYRVQVQGWEPKKAYQEMLDLGFHTILFALDDDFKARTGYQGELNLGPVSPENSAMR